MSWAALSISANSQMKPVYTVASAMRVAVDMGCHAHHTLLFPPTVFNLSGYQGPILLVGPVEPIGGLSSGNRVGAASYAGGWGWPSTSTRGAVQDGCEPRPHCGGSVGGPPF